MVVDLQHPRQHFGTGEPEKNTTINLFCFVVQSSARMAYVDSDSLRAGRSMGTGERSAGSSPNANESGMGLLASAVAASWRFCIAHDVTWMKRRKCVSEEEWFQLNFKEREEHA